MTAWRKRHATGDVIIVRYADDFVIGFESRSDAERCLPAKVTETGPWLRQVVQGWFNYHAVPGNFPCLDQFLTEVEQLWRRALRRRSQRGRRWNWTRVHKVCRRWLPKPKILHPYPNQRFLVTHPR